MLEILSILSLDEELKVKIHYTAQKQRKLWKKNTS